MSEKERATSEPLDDEHAPSRVQEAESAESTEAEAADESMEELPLDELKQRLEAAMKQSTDHRDAALRAQAEMQNIQRRAERDVENAHKYGLERFLQNLLPIADSLEKAIESAEQAAGGDVDTAIIEGVSISLKMLHEVMGKENVDVIDPVGEPFDPQFHEALSMIESPDMEPNSVVTVIQKGYALNGRLVRPAMVIVAKGVSPNLDAKA